MPTYDFRCKKCDRIQENVLLRITHDEWDLPCCCGSPMDYHITTPPMVLWTDPVIEPFKHVAVKSDEVITTTRQNREFMKRHDLMDANDLGPPPSHADQQKELERINHSVSRITPDAEQSAKLAESGLDTILD